MAKMTRAHYSWIAGEADPQFERRNDWEFWINSAESLKNMRLRNGGGIKRRPGLARVATLAGRGRFVPFTATDSAKKLLILEPARYRVMSTDETFETTVTSGMAWASGDLDNLQADFENNDITVTSTSFWPQVLSRTLAGVWSVADLAFNAGGDLSISSPITGFRSRAARRWLRTRSAATSRSRPRTTCLSPAMSASGSGSMIARSK